MILNVVIKVYQEPLDNSINLVIILVRPVQLMDVNKIEEMKQINVMYVWVDSL